MHSYYRILFLSLCICICICTDEFSIKEATIAQIQIAFQHNTLTSRKLVEYYLANIHKLNPLLKAVIEVNPDALRLADKADQQRKSKNKQKASSSLLKLHGIPVLLKDNISTKDKLNTTAGSCSLVGSVVPQDAGVVKKLRKAGAIILGKASMTEWAAFRSDDLPSGWNCRLGQAVNPYVASADPCGSSTGSGISAAANLATVTLGTETAGSILCPSNANSVVGIKPTVGLISRAGVVPISHRQDTVGPICRSVSDAVHVLDIIAGYDPDDKLATNEASMYIPHGRYAQFLKADGLKGKRLGITRNNGLVGFNNNSETLFKAYEQHFTTLRSEEAKKMGGQCSKQVERRKAVHTEKKYLQDLQSKDGGEFPGSDYRPADRKNWMGGLDPGKLRVNQIVWPGTHDSATNKIGIPLITRPFAQCQSLSIYNQLVTGARVLDIRVQEDRKVCHGILTTYGVDVVINDVKKFLSETQSEIIILEIRTEFGHEDPADFDKYLEEELGEYLIHQDDQVFGKTIAELLPKRIICVWKPRKAPQPKPGGPLWSSGYLKDDWIDTDLPEKKFESNMKNMSGQQPVSSRKYFYRVENTVTPQADNPVLCVYPVTNRIHPYARLFINQCVSQGHADKLQIFSTDFIDDDFVDACVGFTSARIQGKI